MLNRHVLPDINAWEGKKNPVRLEHILVVLLLLMVAIRVQMVKSVLKVHQVAKHPVRRGLFKMVKLVKIYRGASIMPMVLAKNAIPII